VPRAAGPPVAGGRAAPLPVCHHFGQGSTPPEQPPPAPRLRKRATAIRSSRKQEHPSLQLRLGRGSRTRAPSCSSVRRPLLARRRSAARGHAAGCLRAALLVSATPQTHRPRHGLCPSLGTTNCSGLEPLIFPGLATPVPTGTARPGRNFLHRSLTGAFRLPSLELQGGHRTGLVCMP